MRTLDYFLQKMGLITCSFLLCGTIFYEDMAMLLFYAMFLMGAYHIIHYFLFLLYQLITKQKIIEFMWVYPLLVVVFFTIWTLLMPNFENLTFYYICFALALGIGGYYCFSVHQKI